ncbi:MAG: radical SAM protein, partial [Desulfobacterales bacterium]|nr:radical SAM protein [Desulfobacterales bacterium]
MALIVNEIFYSLQGESSWTGLPFVFVRLTGCNLRCRYCDTRYAYEEGSAWTLDAILDQVSRFACRRVTLTGGEPLLQQECPDLVSRLLSLGFIVTLETNGSQD